MSGAGGNVTGTLNRTALTVTLALIVQCDLCGTIQQAEEHATGLRVVARSARKAAQVNGWATDGRSDLCGRCRATQWPRRVAG